MLNFATLSECLHAWEFCPLCKKRLDIRAPESIYNIAVSNTHFTVNTFGLDSDVKEPVYSISLKDNTINGLNNFGNDNIAHFILYCNKRFHFSITFGITMENDLVKEIKTNRTKFFFRDSKLIQKHNIIIDYSNNTTIFDQYTNQITLNKTFEIKSWKKQDLLNKINTLKMLA